MCLQVDVSAAAAFAFLGARSETLWLLSDAQLRQHCTAHGLTAAKGVSPLCNEPSLFLLDLIAFFLSGCDRETLITMLVEHRAPASTGKNGRVSRLFELSPS